MLTGTAVKRLDLPHEPGAWIDVRLPAWPVLKRARDIKQRNAISELGEWDEEGIRKARASADLDGRGTVIDSADEYDWQTLLDGVIVGWSATEPVSPATIAELDEETARLVIRACVPERRGEEDLKNGSSASTAISTARRRP